MNQSFDYDPDDFVAAAASAHGWDGALRYRDALKGVADYYTQKDNPMPPSPTPSRTNADLICAGVQACVLAHLTLMQFEKDPHPSARVCVAASHLTLKTWGLEIKKLTPEEAKAVDLYPPAAEEDPEDTAGLAPEEMLLWPPPEPSLPAVYTQNFYVVRGMHDYCDDKLFMAKREVPTVGGMPDSFELLDHQLAPSTQLSFLGTARWSSEHECWLMRMHDPVYGPQGSNLWVYSKALKPGDEIPKVIDAATQAKSTDP